LAIAAAVIAAVVVGGGGLGAGVWSSRQNDTHADALAQWREARALLGAEVTSAEALLARAEQPGMVLSAVEPLASALTRARGLDLDIDPALSRAGDIERAREVVTLAQRTRAELADASLVLAVDVTVHRIDSALMDLEAVDSEHASAVAAAREHLAASEGRTLDDVARVALSEAIDAAELVAGAVDVPGLRTVFTGAVAAMTGGDAGTRRATADGELTVADGQAVTVESVTAHTAVLREHIAALGAAQQAVTDAQGAWQAEQERIAAEQKAAEQAATAAAGAQQRSNTSGGASARTGSSSTAKGSAGAKAPAPKSGSSSTGKPSTGSGSSGTGGSPSGGGQWVVEDIPGPNGCWEMDQFGNGWSC
jgi:hypothetical protein